MLLFFSKIVGLETPVSPIVPIILGDENRALNLSRYLKRLGYLVGAIRPPTVPKGTSRLRVAFNSSHTKFEIKNLANLIKNKLKVYG